MKTIHRTFCYHEFDEKKNEIVQSEERIVERSMTEEEQRQYKKKSIFVWFWRVLSFTSLAAFLTIMVMCYVISSKLGIVLLLLSVPVGVSCGFAIRIDDDLENLLEYFSNSGFELENMIWEEHELAVNDKVKAWREAHPLEEKIRQAKESGNCVDIAAVLKYCGEDLVDRIKH